MIKKMLVTAAAFGIMSTAIASNAVLLGTNASNTQEWWAYADTFTVLSDGYAVLVGARDITLAGKPENRRYQGVMFSTCKSKVGELYQKDNLNSPWSNPIAVSITAPYTLADVIAAELCNAGEQFKQDKQETKSKKKSTPARYNS